MNLLHLAAVAFSVFHYHFRIQNTDDFPVHTSEQEDHSGVPLLTKLQKNDEEFRVCGKFAAAPFCQVVISCSGRMNFRVIVLCEPAVSSDPTVLPDNCSLISKSCQKVRFCALHTHFIRVYG